MDDFHAAFQRLESLRARKNYNHHDLVSKDLKFPSF